MDSAGKVFPLYHVFRDVAQSEAEVLRTQVTDETAVGAVALQTRDGLRVLVANFKCEETAVELLIPVAGNVLVRCLDENSFTEATANPEVFRTHRERVEAEKGIVRLKLLPYGVAFVEAS